MANLVDAIKYVVGQIDYTIKVKQLDPPDPDGKVRVFVCSTTKHLTVGNIITDGGGLLYKVTAIDVNNWVDLLPKSPNMDPFDSDTIIAPDVHVFHGAPASVSEEYIDIDPKTRNKTPFVWVYEHTMSELPGADSPLEATFDARLFLMTWAYTVKFTNDKHNDLAIKPMQNLGKMIIDIINDDFAFNRVDGGRTRPRSRFGVYMTNKGDRKLVIEEDLSGIELRFNLEAHDLSGCDC